MSALNVSFFGELSEVKTSFDSKASACKIIFLYHGIIPWHVNYLNIVHDIN